MSVAGGFLPFGNSFANTEIFFPETVFGWKDGPNLWHPLAFGDSVKLEDMEEEDTYLFIGGTDGAGTL